MSEQVDHMDGFEDGPELTKQELVEALWRCENDLAHQRELVRVLADRWTEDIPESTGCVEEVIAWAEARVAGKNAHADGSAASADTVRRDVGRENDR